MRTEFLYLRRLPIHYVAPPVCDTDFTGTGSPSIVLSTHPRFKVTGLFIQDTGDGFRLAWDTTDGGLCYNIYSLQGDEWVLIGECITENFFDVPDGVFSVTVITREGESEMSDPINTSGGAAPIPFMTVIATEPEVYEVSETPGAFQFLRSNPTAGDLFVRFLLSGTATFGASDDYTLSSNAPLVNIAGAEWQLTLGNGVSSAFVTVEPVPDASVEPDETVIVSLIPTVQYAVGLPDTATVTIKEGCVPETGDDTICSLAPTENTFLSTLSIPSGPSGLVSASYGIFPLGDYKAVYNGGAYKFDGNPNPGDFRIQQYKILYPGSSASYWDQLGTCLFPTQAQVEACVPIGKALTAAGKEGNIQLQFDGAGTPLEYPGGGTDPTFSLYRTRLYPTLPVRVRIKDFNESFFGQCPDFVISGNPVWGGTMTFKNLSPPSFFQWREPNPTNFSLNGQELTFASVEYSDSIVGNSTGCGWALIIEVGLNNAPFSSFLWFGIKKVGNTPQGIYYRDSGCSIGPACLVIEEY